MALPIIFLPFGQMLQYHMAILSGLNLTIDTKSSGLTTGTAELYVGSQGTYYVDGTWNLCNDSNWTTHTVALFYHPDRNIPACLPILIKQRLTIYLKLLYDCNGIATIWLVTTKNGTVFHSANFRKDVWEKAQKASGITDKVPYSLRHTFAAWSLTLGIDMNKLVRLMGHGSKKMVYELHRGAGRGCLEDSRVLWAGLHRNKGKDCWDILTAEIWLFLVHFSG